MTELLLNSDLACENLHFKCGFHLQSAHDHGYINRDVRPDNLLVDEVTGEIFLVDWGSATSISSIALPFEGTVHYSATHILNQLLVDSQAVTFTSAGDLESLVCSAFCLCHPPLQAQLEAISKLQVDQILTWWQRTVWQQRSCWREAMEAARQTDYVEVAQRLQKLMQ